MNKFAELKKRLMDDPEFRDEYERADAEFRLIEERIRAQKKASPAQDGSAERVS
jgi:hypothetical protein